MAKANEKIAEGVPGGFQKIEEGVVSGYKKIEQGVAGGYKKVAERSRPNVLPVRGGSSAAVGVQKRLGARAGGHS